ncbi:MAG: hypothetical protein IJW70_12110 [Clostridia bacterium]|nr:hypothetical protein [Clostridia bacterium]MBQ7380409.1 hypothetical protein [Clostridia bacterium]
MDRTKARNIALRCSVVLVAIGMLVYIIHYSLGQFSTSLSTLPTQEITDYTVLSAEVYVFRDEQVVQGSSDAPVQYLYRDGARVPKDAVYAISYPKEGASAAEISELQQRLDAIAEQIALLEDSKQAGSLITSLNENQAAVTQSYYRVLESIAAGGYANALSESKTLLSHISTYSMLTGSQKSEIMIASLKNNRQSLLDAWGGAPTKWVSTHGTNFVHKCDGYEGVFDYAGVMDMTASEFYAMTEASPVSTKGTVGKMINSHTWYAAIPMNEENAARFEEGNTYTFSFIDNDGIELPLTLERKIASEDKRDGVLVFSCRQTPSGFSFLRTQRVQSVVEQITGYRVPTEALREHNGEKGVYILEDSSVEFRRITIISEGAGYYIVQTFEQDAVAGAGKAEYLRRNDLIITAGRDLYIGKMYG